jgi:hypothetical protein
MKTAEEPTPGQADDGSTSCTLRDATLDGRRADITISGGRIVAITPPESGPGIPLDGRPVVPDRGTTTSTSTSGCWTAAGST